MTDEKIFMVKKKAVFLASLPIKDHTVDEFTIKYRGVTLDEITIFFPKLKEFFGGNRFEVK